MNKFKEVAVRAEVLGDIYNSVSTAQTMYMNFNENAEWEKPDETDEYMYSRYKVYEEVKKAIEKML